MDDIIMSQKEKGKHQRKARRGPCKKGATLSDSEKGWRKSQMIPEKGVSPMVSEETSYQFAGLAAAL